MSSTMPTTLSRPRNNRKIAGVCAGLAERWGMKPGTVRLLFVLSCLLPGPQFVVYLALWAILPSR
ncbi:PspC domain-containing protein [Umezawaea endophytica]|uniref:PspC domain-containing protein n=1 Tax=Umezawaea endophytica TaxID=1654476 RepID=A0A9X3ACZ0_9PSEU|nr:PspC domain-containing protein [Umezawaea endophytica]MCS7475577.1 PspC domain-containing protein [Umezawaea endophytica]